jgi:hypothetical protein
MSQIVRLDQVNKKVLVSGDFEITNEIVFARLDAIPADRYDEELERALVLGCYALSLDNTGELLNKVATDLNGELQKLKVLMDLRGLRQRAATVSGAEAELGIIDVLQTFADEHAWADEIFDTGSATGRLPRRKVGDAVIAIAGTDRRIVVESKADKSVTLGGPDVSDPLTSKADPEKKTAYGQGLTALANRDADIAILVHFEDSAHQKIRDGGIIQFLPEQPAFIVMVDRMAGRWEGLEAAYSLARSLSLSWEAGTEKWQAVDLIVKRLARELARLESIDRQLESMRKSAQDILDAIESVKGTREAVQESLGLLGETMASIRANPADALVKRQVFLELGN